jgi:hypothetical protein
MASLEPCAAAADAVTPILQVSIVQENLSAKVCAAQGLPLASSKQRWGRVRLD